jgi:hypothetical protein
LPERVDVVTLFDVVEHLFDPASVLRDLLGHVTPEGALVIFTGNAGSKFSRRKGSEWWYHGWAGHICCFSEPGIVRLLKRLGADPIHIEEMPYEGGPVRPALRRYYWALSTVLRRREWAAACHSALVRSVRLLRTRVRRGLGPAIADGPTGTDHMLIVGRRSPVAG